MGTSKCLDTFNTTCCILSRSAYEQMCDYVKYLGLRISKPIKAVLYSKVNLPCKIHFSIQA